MQTSEERTRRRVRELCSCSDAAGETQATERDFHEHEAFLGEGSVQRDVAGVTIIAMGLESEEGGAPGRA